MRVREQRQQSTVVTSLWGFRGAVISTEDVWANNDSLMLYSGELCSLSLAAVMFYFIWYGHVVPCMWGDAATVCCVSSSFLEIDIASDMRDEATITRDQHQICWICELFRGTKATCGCDGEEWSCAMWEEVTQDVFILRIHTARVWHQQVRTPLKDYTTGKTREMRWSLEYESEFNMICSCCYSHISARHEEWTSAAIVSIWA